MTDLKLEAIEVMQTVEDTVAYLCSEHQLSGEKVWTMVGTLAHCKLTEFPNWDE